MRRTARRSVRLRDDAMNTRRQILSLALLLAALAGVLVLVYLTAEPSRSSAPDAPRSPAAARTAPASVPAEKPADGPAAGAAPAPAREAIPPSQARHAAGSAIRGRVQDAAGNPLAGAILDLRASDGAKMGRTTSDADGRFSLELPPAASVSLLARHREHAGVLMHNVHAGPDELTIVLEQGFAVHGVISERGTG